MPPPECWYQGFLLAGESRKDTASFMVHLGQRPTEKRQLLILSGPWLSSSAILPRGSAFQLNASDFLRACTSLLRGGMCVCVLGVDVWVCVHVLELGLVLPSTWLESAPEANRSRSGSLSLIALGHRTWDQFWVLRKVRVWGLGCLIIGRGMEINCRWPLNWNWW